MLWVVSAWQPWDYKPLVSHVESGDDPTLGGRWAERWAVQMLPPQIHSWDMLQTSKCVWMIKRTAEIKNILNSLPHEITKIHAKNPTSWQHSLVAWSRICPFILRARNYSPGGEWERRSRQLVMDFGFLLFLPSLQLFRLFTFTCILGNLTASGQVIPVEGDK